MTGVIGSNRCNGCKFYRQIDEHGGACKHEAPVPITVPVQLVQEKGPPQAMVFWPLVPADEEACGQYVPAITLN